MSQNISVNYQPPQRSFRPKKGNQTTNNYQPGQPRPFGQGQSRAARQRRARREQNTTGYSQGVSGGSKKWQNNSVSYSRPQPQRNANNGAYNRNSQKGGSKPSRIPGMANKTSSNQNIGAYVGAVMDPCMAQPCRIPSAFAYPSAILKSSISGNVKTNRNGFAQLVFNPQEGGSVLFIYNADDFNDGGVQTTDATINANMLGRLKPAEVAKHRVVGASIKIRYIGTKDAQSGTITSTFLPHAPTSLKQTFTKEQLHEAFHTSEYGVEKEIECIWIPREDIDLDYMPKNAGGTAFVGRNTSSCVLHIAECVDPENVNEQGQSFTWTVTILTEYIPEITNYLSQVGTADPDLRATQVVQQVVNANPTYVTSPASGNNVAKSVTESFLDAAWDAGSSYLANKASSVAESFLMDISAIF